MSVKFGREWMMKIQDVNGDFQLLNFPLTVDFNIDRTTMSQAADANFTVYNLSENTRNLIRKSSIDFADNREIEFYAGYNGELTLMFKGIVNLCASSRPHVDWMTEIQCGPGVAFASDVSVTYGKGTSRVDNIKNLVNTFMPGVTFAKIGNLFSEVPKLLRAHSYSGSVLTVARQMTGGNFYVDNGQAFVLDTFECLQDAGFNLVDSSTGLLGAPTYDEACNHVKMLFEPRVKMGQQLTLKALDSYLNGNFKVVAINHSGTISGSVAGEAITEIAMQNPRNSKGLLVLTA
jgi:hypothetical protein